MNPLSEGNSLSHYRTSNYIAKSILFPIGEEPLMVLLQVSGKLLKKSCVCVFFFYSKCFPCRVKHCLTELSELLENVLGQRNALELFDSALQIKDSKESCNPLTTGRPACHLPILSF